MDVDDVVLENSSPQAENFHDFGCELFFCKSNQTRNSPPQADFFSIFWLLNHIFVKEIEIFG